MVTLGSQDCQTSEFVLPEDQRMETKLQLLWSSHVPDNYPLAQSKSDEEHCPG